MTKLLYYKPLLFVMTMGAASCSYYEPNAYQKIPITSLEEMAQSNDGKAQYEMSKRFGFFVKDKKGKNIRNESFDWQKEIYWLKKAAENNHDWAQYELAHYYMQNNSPEKSPELYFTWIMRAAQGGFAAAQSELASVYATKKNPTTDDVNAMMYWYETASRSKAGGYSWTGLGHYALAEIYCGEFCVNTDLSYVKNPEQRQQLETAAKMRIERLTGYNIPTDYVKAYIHYDLAGNMKMSYGNISKKLETQMTSEQINQAKSCLSAWKLSGKFCYDNPYHI